MIAEKRGDRSNQKGRVLMQIQPLIFLAALCIPSQAAVGVRVIFGLTDQAETKWDGSATARSGHIASIEPRRPAGDILDCVYAYRALVWRPRTIRQSSQSAFRG
jgi:hypothetical protein